MYVWLSPSPPLPSESSLFSFKKISLLFDKVSSILSYSPTLLELIPQSLSQALNHLPPEFSIIQNFQIDALEIELDIRPLRLIPFATSLLLLICQGTLLIYISCNAKESKKQKRKK